jgi:hypothetical protein
MNHPTQTVKRVTTNTENMKVKYIKLHSETQVTLKKIQVV